MTVFRYGRNGTFKRLLTASGGMIGELKPRQRPEEGWCPWRTDLTIRRTKRPQAAVQHPPKSAGRVPEADTSPPDHINMVQNSRCFKTGV